ncbi:MAG: hypothetical protein J6X89_07335 [Bacteroidales bacterium]|nr:hypothetical protein [Bacteroidales bacterium]
MKELFLLLALTFNPSGEYYSDAAYRDLWAKVDAAMEDDMPQTAVGYLNQLEKMAESRQDTLERYQVMKTTYNCLRQYDWKAANKYYPAFRDLSSQINNNLEYYIQKYPEHPRTGALVVEKISRIKRLEDGKEHPSALKYKTIRKMCVLAADQYPKYEKDFMAMVEQMDSADSGMYCDKTFIYPGDRLVFKLNGRNVASSEFAIYRFNDRYLPKGDITRALASSYGTQFTKQKISSYKNDYNVREQVTTEYTFSKPGIYVAFNKAGEDESSAIIYVSSVALATRQVGATNQVYIADARSGKLLESATVYAYSNDYKMDDSQTMVKPAYLSQKVYYLNGFTPLSQTLYTKEFTSARIFAEHASDMWSPAVDVSKPVVTKETKRSDILHYIYTDRKLYRPGDTVQFKLIALTTNYESGKVLAGKKIEVAFYGPDGGKALATRQLTTNAMGSVAGFFVIPKDKKNGRFMITSEKGNAVVTVAEYKDPKYQLHLDKVESIYTYESQILQTGHLTGYTGEPVEGARVEYKVQAYGLKYGSNLTLAEGELRTDAGGLFEIPFVVPRPDDTRTTSTGCYLTVKTVARNGETCEQSKYIVVSKTLLNFDVEVDGQYQMDTLLLVNKDKASRMTVKAYNMDGNPQNIEGAVRILADDDEKVFESKVRFGEPVDVDFAKFASGTYTIEYKAESALGESRSKQKIVLFSPDDRKCPVERNMFFYPVNSNGEIDFMVGTASELYLELELFDNGKPVYHRALHLDKGAQHIKLDYKKEYSDKVSVQLFGFKDMEQISQRYDFERVVPSHNFEINVSGLRDKTTPNTTETFTVEAPASEMLISIYDVTSDRYGKNEFYFSPIRPKYSSVPHVWSNLDGWYRPVYRAYGSVRMMSKGVMVEEEAMVMNEVAMSYDMADDGVSASKMGAAPAPEAGDIDVREDFAQTLAFIPQLAVPANGKAQVTFTTRDGLSAFRIAMLAHTKNLNSGTAESQIIVNKALKLEASLPLFVIEGDRLAVSAMVTNTSRDKVTGTARVKFVNVEDGEILDMDAPDETVTLNPDESRRISWLIKAPKDVEKMDVTLSFASKNASDAEKHQIQILPSSRFITEAESFIVGGGRTKDKCMADFKARIPYPGATVRYEEYSTKEAIAQVLKKPAMPKGDNMIEWLDALYVNQMRGCIHGDAGIDAELTRKAVKRLAQLQKEDGGFGWFPCNSSSDLLTLMFLDKTYYMREVGKLPRGTSINTQIEKALGYVDKRIFEITSAKKWEWRDLTYLFAARMEHPNFAMSQQIQNILLDYLKKSKSGWQKIPTVEKAKLCFVLEATGENAHLFAVMRSLRDYAVMNSTVGCYFPTAVMPYRGMLHTEIYAHSLLAVIFAEMGQMDVAKGVMKWLLLQKHNQEWDSNMASADAVFALLKYKAPELLFGAVYYTYYAPMTDVKAASNQLGVKRTYWRGGKQLKDGQLLRVGDKIEVHYDITNTENRSFVVMEAGRPACFYPADERSFGSYRFYCDKKAEKTTYYFQVLPEEDTHLTETFYVTQEGVFNSSLVEIESLYAPEYRGHTAAFKVETEM